MNRFFLDLPLCDGVNLYYAGEEKCLPNHEWSGLRDHYLVHIVVSGKGSLSSEGLRHQITPGYGFIVAPETVMRYRADRAEPWHYLWFAFQGRAARELVTESGLMSGPGGTAIFPVPAPEACVSIMRGMVETGSDPCMRLLMIARIYEFFHLVSARKGESGPLASVTRSIQGTMLSSSGSMVLAASGPVSANSEIYIRAVRDYIVRNYSLENCRVADMADRIGLNRSYLSALVRAETGRSPRELIAEYRFTRAAELLRSTNLNVRQIARSVGYSDQLLFSKRFRKRFGVSPSIWRNADMSGGSELPPVEADVDFDDVEE